MQEKKPHFRYWYVVKNLSYEHRLSFYVPFLPCKEGLYCALKEQKMKVNVANYVYADLLKRFPLSSEQAVDSDLIDVLIQKWANKEYLSPDSTLKIHRKQNIFPPHLM
jgi:hypothetical protein